MQDSLFFCSEIAFSLPRLDTERQQYTYDYEHTLKTELRPPVSARKFHGKSPKHLN